MPVVNIPRSFQQWSAIAATPSDFNLDAGQYSLQLSATAWGTAQLNQLQPDGVTYIPVTAVINANSASVLALPAGQYRLVLGGPIANLTGQIALIARGLL